MGIQPHELSQNPPTHTYNMNNTLCPPADCPAHLLSAVNLWQLEPKNLLSLNKVPWAIQAAIAQETYTTLSDLANRWCDTTDLWNNADKDYHRPTVPKAHVTTHREVHKIRPMSR